jgi:hypothetical protein
MIVTAKPNPKRENRNRLPNVYRTDTLLSMKDAGLRIHVQREIHEQFLEARKADVKPAVQVLRKFMRG